MPDKIIVYYKFCQSYNDFGNFHELHMGQNKGRVDRLESLLMMIPTKHRDLESIKNRWAKIIKQLDSDEFEMKEIK